MAHIILHTIEDSVGIIPFLFLTYLVMEWLEHRAGNQTRKFIQKSGKFGPVIGGLLGAVPQCGFSAAAANLYAGGVITTGTLLAIFLSTSDEMLPIFLSEQVALPVILKVIGLKVVVGILAGFLIDLLRPKKTVGHEHIHEICEHEHCHCGEGKGIFVSAFRHTLQITLFLVLITFVLNAVLHVAGEEALGNLILNKPVIGPLLAGIVGLVPNCAASVVITQLYLEGAMSFGAMMSGLLVGAGVGILVLLRSNTDRKEDIKIIGMLFAIGVVAGVIIEFLKITV